ncbi:MAG: alpha/beta hydrolase [Desulfobacterales bacterium]|nr:alpha/beta hydrolase [Desulfobacterales bacterium]
MEHKIISGTYGSVHYWVKGQVDDCIIFTHGATMDHDLFQYQIEYFAQKHKVIVWDVPGHGLSRPYKGFSLQRAAGELIEILNSENVEKAHLVGQSMGGYIIQYIARGHPERVMSLTAVGSSPLQPSYYSALDTWLLSIAPHLLRLFPYSSLIKMIAKQVAIKDTARAYALETLKKHSKKEIAEIMGAVYGGVKEYKYEGVLPVDLLIIIGDAERTGKVKSYSRRWAESEKRPLKIIANAAHNTNMDNPEEFNEILGEFLKKAEL